MDEEDGIAECIKDMLLRAVVGLVDWMEEKVSESRSRFYRKNGALVQRLWWRPSSRKVFVVPLQPLI